MKSVILLSATASLMLLGSTAVFAQAYAPPGAITLKPGQIQSVDPSSQRPASSAPSAIGIVTLKPGETVNTAGAQDFGSVQAATTTQAAGAVITLKPGQPG